jgi:two-component system cell cycle sensor histidine kinase/response regulator CckA
LKILVVDDEPAVLRLCGAILERSNFIAVLAENGLQALDIFHEMHSELVLIISDVLMPVMDGPTFVRKVFQHTPKSNVILMTGFDPENMPPEDLKRLCSIINKPFTPKQLIDVVNKCLEYQVEMHPEQDSN